MIALLFDRDIKTISKHINNALKEELDSSTIAKFATVQTEGKRSVERQLEYYNLDMIVSIGYRVKSKNGIIFRRWANKILKEYMLNDYAVNQKRLEYLEKTIQLLNIANRNNNITGDEAKDILNIINEYTKALDLLDDYDHRTLKKIDGNKRIAATIFIYFLQRYNILYKNNSQVIDNNTLTSITLLIAESNPKEKELMIDLILNFLK